MTETTEIGVPPQPKKKDTLIAEELEGMDEVIFVDTESGSNFSLNTMASAILDLCDGTHTADDIARLICETLDGDMERIRKDTRAILTEFAAYGLFTE
ncbi:MAG: PqqD family protein [Mariprofundaceae bacterium]|nr:PqqD family protein [Mariprofundaceae bacterium]